MTDLRVALAHKHAETIYRGYRDVGGDLLTWDTLPSGDRRSVYALIDPLLPVIAAHEAEVVGSVLDRIDALHQSEDVPTSQHYYCEPYECDRAGEGGMEPICTECRVDFPCPTRRLTAKIRGEMSHG